MALLSNRASGFAQLSETNGDGCFCRINKKTADLVVLASRYCCIKLLCFLSGIYLSLRYLYSVLSRGFYRPCRRLQHDRLAQPSVRLKKVTKDFRNPTSDSDPSTL